MLGLFVVGLSFGYFVVHPISYFFLIEMGQINFDVLVTADEYIVNSLADLPAADCC